MEVHLTCEENFDNLFGSTDKKYKFSKSEYRYGIGLVGDEYDWYKFDVNKNLNKPNRFDLVAEIDHYNSNSTPIKE